MRNEATRVAMISMHGDPAAELGAEGAGGQNVYVKETALALERRNVSVDVFTRRADEHAPDVEFISERVRVIRLHAGESRYLDRDELHRHMAEFSKAMIDFIHTRSLSYAALHTHYWHSGWTGLRVKAAFGLRHFHTTHSLGITKHQHLRTLPLSAGIRISVEREILEGCDCIVATCPQEEVIIKNCYTPNPRVVVVPCGVNLSHFRPLDRQESRRALGLKHDQNLVLFVGRFDERKGLDTLLNSIALLQRDMRSLHLAIIGGTTPDGADKREYDRTVESVARLGLQDTVSFLGRVPHERLGLHYTAADVVAVPSHYEPFGLVAVEAMACGVPVVASQVGGLQYSIENGQTGLLVPPRDAPSLAAAIDRLLRDRKLSSRMGALAVNRVYKHFNWSEIADRLLALYLQEQSARVAAQISAPWGFKAELPVA